MHSVYRYLYTHLLAVLLHSSILPFNICIKCLGPKFNYYNFQGLFYPSVIALFFASAGISLAPGTSVRRMRKICQKNIQLSHPIEPRSLGFQNEHTATRPLDYKLNWSFMDSLWFMPIYKLGIYGLYIPYICIYTSIGWSVTCARNRFLFAERKRML